MCLTIIGGVNAMAAPTNTPIEPQPDKDLQEWSTPGFVLGFLGTMLIDIALVFRNEAARVACTTPGTIAGIDTPFNWACAATVCGIGISSTCLGYVSGFSVAKHQS